MTHAFDEAIALETVAPSTFRAHTHPAYNNMVGPFGGITAATVVHGLQQHPEILGAPLALTLNYTAPIGEGEWLLTTTLVRTNRTNQHWSFSIDQNEHTVATGTAVFGIRRETWSDVEATAPEAGSPDDHAVNQFPAVVAWMANYEMRFVTGLLDPQAGASDDSTSTLWVRDLPDRPLDYPALASVSDVFFPRAFLRLGSYTPAGTISLTTYFHATADELAAQGTRPVLATARAARFAHGHFDQYGQIWGADGSLLATTHQLVYYKNPQG